MRSLLHSILIVASLLTSMTCELRADQAFNACKGILEGRLINGTDPSISTVGIEVEVIGFAAGMTTIGSAVTGPAGDFRLAGLPTAGMLMVRADYKSVSYHSLIDFGGKVEETVSVQVYETTRSSEGIRLADVRLAYEMSGDELRSLESYEFRNETNPPMTFLGGEGGAFLFSKAPGLLEEPGLSVTAPGSTMPLSQAPFESSDGRSYYSDYPLRPGVTSFAVEQIFPYQERRFEYRKIFYQNVESLNIGVLPKDLIVTGDGLVKLEIQEQGSFSVYSSGPIEAGAEVVWTFSGGTSAPITSQTESRITNFQNAVGSNSTILVPLILMGFILVLWYGYNFLAARPSIGSESRARELKGRREMLLDYLATLDRRFEAQIIDKGDYHRQRDFGKRQLRRIAILLKKK